jgi:hypothetical protein
MPDVQEAPLSPEEATRLAEFARALKAATRAVLLYPMGHPAIAITLGRIVEMTSSERLSAPLRITVLPDGLCSTRGHPRAPTRRSPSSPRSCTAM